MRFPLGKLVATPAAIEALGTMTLLRLVQRHSQGDWGDLDENDKQANEDAIAHGERILSAYAVGGDRYYVVTEWDRSLTTVMLSDEY